MRWSTIPPLLLALLSIGCSSSKETRDAWHHEREAKRIPDRVPEVLTDAVVSLGAGETTTLVVRVVQTSRLGVSVKNDAWGDRRFSVEMRSVPESRFKGDSTMPVEIVAEHDVAGFARSAEVSPGSYELIVRADHAASAYALRAHVRVVASDPIGEMPPSF